MVQEFKVLLKQFDKVSIVTHKNPDADTLGTALGIYEILKNEGKEVEVCNWEGILPNYLDFLPHFAKIKRQIDFDKSLIISCDSGSIDLLEFNLSSRVIVNIDHHKSNTNYGTLNIVNDKCASASQVAYELLKDDFTITKNTATCFYVAMVTDTQNFTTLNVTNDVFKVAEELLSTEVDIAEVNRNLTQRKSLSSLRILSETLDTLEFYEEARVVSLVATQKSFKRTGATVVDTIGIIDYGIALSTAKIAIFIMELEETLKVSFRSSSADVSGLAIFFGGGGHRLASGFSIDKMDIQELLNNINREIKQRGLLDEL